MKSTDIALIILIAAVSIVAAYFIGNAVLGDPSDKVETLSYIKEIDDEVVSPDSEVFNPYNINPTQEVYVGRCEVGQVYDTANKKCRDFSISDITTNPNVPVPVTPDNPDEPDNPDNPEE